MYYIFFVHSSVDGHVGCLHVLTIVNSVAMNIWVHVYFFIRILSGCLPSSGIARSCGSSIFSFLKNLPVVLHGGSVCVLSRVQLSVTPWTVAHQAPLSMGFPRQEYWSGVPFPHGDLPNPGFTNLHSHQEFPFLHILSSI